MAKVEATQASYLREDHSARFMQVVVKEQPFSAKDIASGPEMGRVSQVAVCNRCGYIGQTRLAYIRGMWTYAMFAIMMAMAMPVALMCLLGEPFWVKRAFWDVEHFCWKCGHKLGYNVQCAQCCCLYSAAFDFPKDAVVPMGI